MNDPNYHLEAVIRDRGGLEDFEGPLSLILMLLSKNKIEIRDLQISQILDQYLDYLSQMESMDLEIASEFVQMASHLLYIKTRTLLAGEEEVSELELLMASLEQLKCKDVQTQVQAVLPELKRASEKGLLYFSKPPEPLPQEAKLYRYSHQPEELLKALWGLYARGVKPPEPDISAAVPQRIVYSVREKSRQILQGLSKGPCTLGELYSRCATRSEIVATFISVLELCSMGSLLLEKTGEGDYRLEHIGGDLDEILEKILE